MKKTTLLSLASVFLVAMFFGQPTNVEAAKPLETSFAACKVKKSNAEFFVSSTEKTIKLRKGTSLSWTIPDIHQGLIAVKAKIGTKWIKGEILLDDTTCN
ncbi:MAG TPA: hypothetical protein PKA82_06075 [Pyrinomonadaceae bacterium]|nr:hypothetical protein [Pyrinomonadaceae bacterium]